MVRGPLPEEEFHAIFSRVARLTVEVVIVDPHRGVLLSLRETGPCAGLWHLPGGTVRFAEPVVDAVARVARDELGVAVTAGPVLGVIEYPSHYEHGLDSPVGLALRADLIGAMAPLAALRSTCRWFTAPPAEIHDEQRDFLAAHVLGRT